LEEAKEAEKKTTKDKKAAQVLARGEEATTKDEAAIKKDLDSKMLPAKTLKELKRTLVNQYGSLMKAWKEGLDRDGSGTISFDEFCEAAKRIGFLGDVKSCWKKLDVDGSGEVSLNEFAPEADEAMTAFKRYLVDYFGSYMNAWNSMHKKKGGNLDKARFLQALKEMGYTGSEKEHIKLFEYLKEGLSRDHLILADIDEDTAQMMELGSHFDA